MSQAVNKARPATEHHLQVQSITWFAWQYPLLDGLLFAIPNGGHRHRAVAGKLKAEGVRSGVADLFLSMARQGNHGLYIEFKTPSGRQNNAQKFFQQRVTAEGYAYVIVRGLDDFQDAINDYLAPATLPGLPGHGAGLQYA